MPHSKPDWTSRASSLNRRSDVIVPFQMIVALAQEADLRSPGDDALSHVAAGDRADPWDPEDLADLGLAGDDLFELGREQPEHGGLDLLDQLVDDLVGPDLDVARPRRARGCAGRGGR